METIKHRPSLNMHWIIRSVLIFFKIIGLATFSVRNAVSKKHSKVDLVFVSSKLGLYYNWILTLAAIGSFYIDFPTVLPYTYATKTGMIMGIRIVVWTLECLALNTILVSHCVNQADLVRISNHLMGIEWELRRILHPVKRASASLVIIVTYLFNGFLDLGIYIIEVFVYETNPIDRVVGRIQLYLLCWFIIQYFSVVSLVNAFFVDVNTALLSISKDWSANFHPESSRERRRTFVSTTWMQLILQLRNLHERLCQVSIEISQFYSVSIFLAITFIFFRLIYEIYYLTVLLMTKETRSLGRGNIIRSVLIIISLIYCVLVLSNKITNIMDEIARTGRTVHLLLNCTTDKNLRAELKQFSFQLLHYGVEFSANGYFTLDNTFVNSVAGVLFTYLVIMIQFHFDPPSQTVYSDNYLINDTQQLNSTDNVSNVELVTYSA